MTEEHAHHRFDADPFGWLCADTASTLLDDGDVSFTLDAAAIDSFCASFCCDAPATDDANNNDSCCGFPGGVGVVGGWLSGDGCGNSGEGGGGGGGVGGRGLGSAGLLRLDDAELSAMAHTLPLEDVPLSAAMRGGSGGGGGGGAASAASYGDALTAGPYTRTCHLNLSRFCHSRFCY